MLTLLVSVERDRAYASADGARFRVKLRPANGQASPSLASSPHGSVAAAKRDAERLFGPLVWTEGTGDTRAVAAVSVA